MGGEPTFVSIDDPDGPEWNFTAVSPEEARALRRPDQAAARAVRARRAAALRPGQVVSGRIAAALGAWLLTGARTACRSGRTTRSSPTNRRTTATRPARGAKNCIDRIGRVLGVDPEVDLCPAYEDAFYYLWKERRLPVNVDPEKSKLKDKQERERLAANLRAGARRSRRLRRCPSSAPGTATSPAGCRGPWFLRDDDTLWLIPGDSPMGLRLPIDSHSVGGGKGLSLDLAAGSVAGTAAGSAEGISAIAPGSGLCAAAARRCLPGRGPGQRAQELEPPDAAEEIDPNRRPVQGESAAVDRPHGDVRRAARRTAARLHAAGRDHGGLPRSHRRHREPPSPKWACRSSSRARRRPTTRA